MFVNTCDRKKSRSAVQRLRCQSTVGSIRGQPFGVSPNQMGRCTIARHGSRSASRAPRDFSTSDQMPGAINMGMADGHVELVKLEDLWKYYWHLDWQPPVTRPQ